MALNCQLYGMNNAETFWKGNTSIQKFYEELLTDINFDYFAEAIMLY